MGSPAIIARYSVSTKPYSDAGDDEDGNLDKKLAKEKPGYREYMERTSGLIPLPPRRRASD